VLDASGKASASRDAERALFKPLRWGASRQRRTSDAAHGSRSNASPILKLFLSRLSELAPKDSGRATPSRTS